MNNLTSQRDNLVRQLDAVKHRMDAAWSCIRPSDPDFEESIGCVLQLRAEITRLEADVGEFNAKIEDTISLLHILGQPIEYLTAHRNDLAVTRAILMAASYYSIAQGRSARDIEGAIQLYIAVGGSMEPKPHLPPYLKSMDDTLRALEDAEYAATLINVAGLYEICHMLAEVESRKREAEIQAFLLFFWRIKTLEKMNFR